MRAVVVLSGVFLWDFSTFLPYIFSLSEIHLTHFTADFLLMSSPVTWNFQDYGTKLEAHEHVSVRVAYKHELYTKLNQVFTFSLNRVYSQSCLTQLHLYRTKISWLTSYYLFSNFIINAITVYLMWFIPAFLMQFIFIVSYITCTWIHLLLYQP